MKNIMDEKMDHFILAFPDSHEVISLELRSMYTDILGYSLDTLERLLNTDGTKKMSCLGKF